MNDAHRRIAQLGLLIGGRIVQPPGRTRVENPSTGATLADVATGSIEELDAAVAAANAAAPRWAAAIEPRQQALAELAQALLREQALFAQMLALELGLPLKVAAQEVTAAAGFLQHRAAAVPRTDTLVEDSRQIVRVVRVPIGVVGAIVPWNAPLMMAAEKLGSALVAGNTVVLKPSPLAPLSVLLLGELIRECMPPGVVNLVHGGEELGPAMVEHPVIGMISFTGSTITGRRIMAAAGPGLKRLSLELGGNDAALVFADTDPARAAEKVLGAAFYRSGQICVGIKRVYVQRKNFDGFVSAAQRFAEALPVGDPENPAVVMGPLSNRLQFERVKAFAKSAVAEGGKVIAGGRAQDRAGYFFAPTLVTGLAPTARLVAEEQFGPILPILPFDDEEEAVALANDTPYGLGNSVWTDDPVTAQRIAAQLQSGSVWINRHGLVLPDVPFGGMKQSGIGRANGQVGLDHYCELKTVSAALPRKA